MEHSAQPHQGYMPHMPAELTAKTSGVVLSDIFVRIVKYLIEGLAVAGVAYLTLKGKSSAKDIALLGVTAACIFAILDLFAPAVGVASRQGAGFATGAALVGFGGIPMGTGALPGVPLGL